MYSTVTLSWRTSSANALVNVAMNALAAEYGANIGEGTLPTNDPIFKISPRFLFTVL